VLKFIDGCLHCLGRILCHDPVCLNGTDISEFILDDVHHIAITYENTGHIQVCILTDV
jgi:hypothetical protein